MCHPSLVPPPQIRVAIKSEHLSILTTSDHSFCLKSGLTEYSPEPNFSQLTFTQKITLLEATVSRNFLKAISCLTAAPIIPYPAHNRTKLSFKPFCSCPSLLALLSFKKYIFKIPPSLYIFFSLLMSFYKCTSSFSCTVSSLSPNSFFFKLYR